MLPLVLRFYRIHHYCAPAPSSQPRRQTEESGFASLRSDWGVFRFSLFSSFSFLFSFFPGAAFLAGWRLISVEDVLAFVAYSSAAAARISGEADDRAAVNLRIWPPTQFWSSL
jgi:hypothetical protein